MSAPVTAARTGRARLDPEPQGTEEAPPRPAKPQKPETCKKSVDSLVQGYRRPVPKPMLSALEPSAPVEVRMRAGAALATLEEKFDRSKRVLERVIQVREARAKQAKERAIQDAKQGIFREGISETPWHHELQADTARKLLKQLKVEFGEAKHAHEGLLGLAKGAAVRQGSKENARVTGPGTAEERFLARLDRCNRSIDSLKSSGIVGALAVGAKVGVVAIQGREFDDLDRQELTLYTELANIANVPIGIIAERGRVNAAAASPAPGVDYRDAPKDATRDLDFDARYSRALDR